GREGLGAEVSTVIQVVIPPATEANVGAVRQRLLVELDRLDKLEKTEQTWMEYRRVADHIRYAHHPGLIPVAFRLLRVPDEPLVYYSKSRLVEDIFASARQPQEAHDLFLKHLLSDHPVAAEKVFDFWRGLRWTASPGYVWERVPSLRDVTVAPVRYL